MKSRKSQFTGILDRLTSKNGESDNEGETIGSVLGQDIVPQSEVLKHRDARINPSTKKEKKQERVLRRRVDPSICRMWDRHNRRYDLLNADNCEDLIEGFKAQGQQIPAIVREIDDEKYPYEVICGARRHWTSVFLKHTFYIEIHQLTDKQAFLLADAENRQRVDISDYERALDYLRALENDFSSQREMAKEMDVDEKWLSDYLTLAELNKTIIEAYKTVTDIKVHHAKKLTALINKDMRTKMSILKTAELLKGQGLKGSIVFKRLQEAGKEKRKPGGLLVEQDYTDDSGKPVFKITRSARGGYKIQFEKDLTSEISAIERLVVEAIREHMG